MALLDSLAAEINQGSSLLAGGSVTLLGKSIPLATTALAGLVDMTIINKLEGLEKLLQVFDLTARWCRRRTAAQDLGKYTVNNVSTYRPSNNLV